MIGCYFNPRSHMLFCHRRTHMGESCHPRTISPLIEIETLGKDQTNFEDILSGAMSGLTSLGHMTYLEPFRSGQPKNMIFSAGFFFRITLEP